MLEKFKIETTASDGKSGLVSEPISGEWSSAKFKKSSAGLMVSRIPWHLSRQKLAISRTVQLDSICQERPSLNFIMSLVYTCL